MSRLFTYRGKRWFFSASFSLAAWDGWYLDHTYQSSMIGLLSKQMPRGKAYFVMLPFVQIQIGKRHG